MKRIHIVGSSPRSGTTLLHEVMASCFFIDHVSAHEKSISKREPLKGDLYLTKKPGEINAVRMPLLFNPELHVICIMRDPRDTVVSFHGKSPDIYWCGLRYWKLFVSKYETLVRYPKFIPVKYEDFVSDPDMVQKYLMRKIPFLQKKYDFSQYHLIAKPGLKSLKALRALRPIDASAVGNWKNHLPRIKQQIAIHGDISDELIKFGYESDKSWEKSLEGVDAVDYQTKTGEHFTLGFTLRRKIKGIRASVNIIEDKVGGDPAAMFHPMQKLLRLFRPVFTPVLKPAVLRLDKKFSERFLF